MKMYTDNEQCKCIYAGSQQNYQQYERLTIHQEVVDEQHTTAIDNKMAAEMNALPDWDVWGMWPRPVIY